MVAVAVLGVLKSQGILDSSIADALIALWLGFIGVRTVDRFAEKASEVKNKWVNWIFCFYFWRLD